MNSIWFFENVNVFNLLCPHKFKEYKECHTFDRYKKNDYVYFESDAATPFGLKPFVIKLTNQSVATAVSITNNYGGKAISGAVNR